MTKDRRYQVGTDNENNDTVRTTLMAEATLNAARVYGLTVAPKLYERTWEVNGRLVEVIVREVEERRTK